MEIAPKEGFYDYKNKYQAGSTVETCPAALSPEKTKEIQDIAVRAFQALGLKTYTRFDFMMDENDTPWLTDLNPRVTATIIIYAGAGMNFPYLRVKQLLGESMPKVNLQYGTKLVRKYTKSSGCRPNPDHRHDSERLCRGCSGVSGCRNEWASFKADRDGRGNQNHCTESGQVSCVSAYIDGSIFLV